MNIAINRRTSIIFLVIAAILWSTSGIFIRLMDWPPLAILSARSIFSSLVFAIYLRRFPRKITRWQILAAGGYILTQFLYVSSVQLTTAANAIFLQYTAPIYIIIMGYWFLHEKPGRADWISLAVIFSGLILFFGGELSTRGFYGNILAALSGVTMALMMVSMRMQKHANPAESIFMANLFCAIFGIPFVLQAHWTPLNWSILAYLGLFQMGLAFLLYSIAMKHVPALEATLVGTLEPILNPAWVFLFLGENPGGMALIGAVVVLVGVIYNATIHTREET